MRIIFDKFGNIILAAVAASICLVAFFALFPFLREAAQLAVKQYLG